MPIWVSHVGGRAVVGQQELLTPSLLPRRPRVLAARFSGTSSDASPALQLQRAAEGRCLRSGLRCSTVCSASACCASVPRGHWLQLPANGRGEQQFNLSLSAYLSNKYILGNKSKQACVRARSWRIAHIQADTAHGLALLQGGGIRASKKEWPRGTRAPLWRHCPTVRRALPCLVHQAEPRVPLQVGVVSAFAQTLRRYTSLNHLAQAARAVLQNTAQINQMLSDLNRVDFANVQVTPRGAKPQGLRGPWLLGPGAQ